MTIESQELIQITGGGTISGAALTAIYRLLGTVLEVGRSLGTWIRMVSSGKKC